MKFILKSRYVPRIILILLIIVAVICYRWFFYYYTYSRDAYVYANTVNISSTVTGNITKIFVKDNQAVKKNQPLVEIDPRPFKYALANVKAKLFAAKISYEKSANVVNVAKDNLDEKMVALNKSVDYLKRITTLLKEKAISKITFINAQAAEKSNQAAVNLAKQQLFIAKQGVNNTLIQAAEADVENAQYKLDHSTVRAPGDGYITNLLLRPGNYINSGEALFALIETDHWWIVARYRETVLRRIRIGAKVKIHIDMYPSLTLHGIVETIGWGINRRQASSSAASSALTYLEPTEDWIRIAQRFPVRIKILNPNPKYPLRIGSSARTTVSVNAS